MSVYLLDVNVLVALVWPAHQFHEIATNWFARHARQGWATCPFTEAGLVRTISNPAFSPQAVSPHEASAVLADLTARHRYKFWPGTLTLDRATAPLKDRIVGHKQITDAYLLGLAIHKGGTLATFDQAIAALLPQSHPGRTSLEIIR
jgi:toxin-antitoxin system PIN domain toxin